MNKITSILLLTIFSIHFSSAQVVLITPENDPLLKKCIELVNSGNFPNSGKEIFCRNNFDIPDAYLLKCLSMTNNGFPTNSDKRACGFFFSEGQERIANLWGPWSHYEIEINMPEELRSSFIELKIKWKIED